jgi:hypothetical protein
MDFPPEGKRARYDSAAVGNGLLLGLNEKDNRDLREWVAESMEQFRDRLKTGYMYFAPIQIVAYKTLTVMANVYTGDVRLMFKSTRPKIGNASVKSEFVLRLTLEEFQGLQKTLKWIEAFIKKVQTGSLELDATSPGVTQEAHERLGYEKKITEGFSVIMKFKKGDKASTVELRKGNIKFNISAGGFQFYIKYMSENVRVHFHRNTND